MRVGEDARYLDHLLELRQQFDVYPWAEVMFGVVAAGAAAGASPAPALGMQIAEDLLVSEFTALSLGQAASQFDENDFETLFKIQSGPNPDNQAKRAFNNHAVFGFPNTGWRRLGAGLFVPAETGLQFDATTTLAAFGAGTGVRIWVIARGYKLRRRGSITPPQRTLEELRQAYLLQPYLEGTRVTVPASAAVAPGYIKHKFLENFAITAISLHPKPDDPQESSLISVKISPPFKLMSDFANWTALCGDQGLQGKWDFPLPITVMKNEEWEFEAKHLVTAAAVNDLDFVLHGYQLKPRAR